MSATATFIERIYGDPSLAKARRNLSARDLYAIAGHIRGPYVNVIRALLKDPHGCRFCDYGKLRTPDDPTKGHDSDCPYLRAELLHLEPTPWTHQPIPQDVRELIDELERGVVEVGMHEDNSTSLYDVDGASETMANAAAMLTRLADRTARAHSADALLDVAERREAVADALAQTFKSAVEAGAQMPFYETGVTVPGRDVWLRYADAALTAIRKSKETTDAEGV